MGKILATAIAAWLMGCTGLVAQQLPNNAGGSVPSVSGSSGQQTANKGQTTGTETPATSASRAQPPLSGFGSSEIGQTGETRSYILPSIEASGSGDTNAEQVAGHPGLNYYSTYVWNLELQRVKRTSQFNLSYAGGERLYSSPLNAGTAGGSDRAYGFHSLAMGEQVTRRRLAFKLLDTFSYLPESQYGFGGFSGLNSFGGGLGAAAFANAPSLQSILLPNQTVLTGRARSLSNLATAELDYQTSRRSEVTVGGGYGTLQYIDPGFINSYYWLAQTGYNHQLSRRDQIGIIYSATVLKFNGINQEILNQGLELAYGHQITNKLALKLAAGPQVTDLSLPIGGSLVQWFLATDDSLEYRLAKRRSVRVSFARTLTNGSGVLFGAESDVVRAELYNSFTRNWSGSLSLGYARNQALSQLPAAAAGIKYQAYVGSASINRQLGKTISMFISYSVQRQVSDSLVAVGGSGLGPAYLRQIVTVGINWHGHPRLLDGI